MPFRTGGTRQNGLFVDYGFENTNDSLKLGEVIESRVIRVFPNGRLLVDMKGTPIIAATTVPLQQGTTFSAKVRRNGRQKWLQIMDNNIESTAIRDIEAMLQIMGLEINELHLLAAKVLRNHNYDPNPELIHTISDYKKKFIRTVSDPELLVECIVYLLSQGLEVSQANILRVRTLLGPEYLFGEKLDQIRHYKKVSHRRNMATKDSDHLSTILRQIPIRLPGLVDSVLTEIEDNESMDPEIVNSFRQFKSFAFCKINHWIDTLTKTRNELSASGKSNCRIVGLMDQCVRMAEALKLTCNMRDDGSSFGFLYFQIPIFYENRISTIEGKIIPTHATTVANESSEVDIEAIWRMPGQSMAHFHLLFTSNSWQVIVKTRDENILSILEQEFSTRSLTSDQDSGSQFNVEIDEEFVQENSFKDLRWPPNLFETVSIDLVA